MVPTLQLLPAERLELRQSMDEPSHGLNLSALIPLGLFGRWVLRSEGCARQPILLFTFL
jgi:hypothetical protein